MSNFQKTRAKHRVLLVAPYYLPSCYGGAVQLYHQLLTGLDAFETVVLTQRLDRGDTTLIDSFDQTCPRKFGYHVRRLQRFELMQRGESRPLSRIRDVAALFRTAAAEWRATLRDVRPNLIICGATYIAGWLMNRRPAEVPVINYLHGEELSAASESRFLRPLLSRQQMRAIRHSVLNIAVSRYTAARAVELARIPIDRVVVLPNFVDTHRFAPPRNRDEVRARLGWSDKRIVLSLARLTPRKGIDQALRAMAQLRRAGQLPPGWRYVIAGTGDQEQELQSLVSQLGLRDCTRFDGFVSSERLAEYYGAADIFLQPNRDMSGDTEGFGIVFIEAAACGTPVIGGIAGGTADSINHGVTGLRVNAERVSEIADALRMLIHDDHLRTRMGRAGIEMVQERFRMEPARERFQDLVLTTLQRGNAYGEGRLGLIRRLSANQW